MGLTSAAESKLDARIRPEITMLRARTSYPKRHRPLTVVPEEAPAEAAPRPEARVEAAPKQEAMTDEPANSVAGLMQRARQARAAREPASVPVTGPASTGPASTGPASTGPASTGPASTGPGAAGRPGVSKAATSRRPVPEGPVRLTRRGRIVVGALVVMGVAAAVSLVWLLVASQAQASSHVQPGQTASHALSRVVVRPGQTLWTIAEVTDPTADPRVVIQEIIDENSLTGTAIQPGQVLWVPRS